MGKAHFVMALHDHQPVGNFDVVFEQSCNDAYKPFLDVLQRHPKIRMSIHFSGSLLEWIEEHRPDIVEQLQRLVQAGQLEIIGGGYYEPILTMLPRRDMIGQIQTYTQHLEELFNTKVNGYWLTERVWEQSLTKPLVDAGVKYTIVDDTHFKYAGLKEEQLNGYFVTEDEGRVLRLYAGSEYLRYVIPFDDPQKTIDYIGEMNTVEDSIIVYADDGEKFGVWPKTHEHVYKDGWLDRFFNVVEQNLHWIDLLTLSEVIEKFPPRMKVYLPDASYREMTEWALPAPAQVDYEATLRELEQAGLFDRAKLYVRGGFWRNFKMKYPEANNMYSKMLYVSDKLDKYDDKKSEAYKSARSDLYRGQCNCTYWHGVFGGLYLPHLRHAVYDKMIQAEATIDAAAARDMEARVVDFDTDGKPEIYLANKHIAAVVKPDRGGHTVEFDVRQRPANLLGGLSRRYEAYHENIKNPPPSKEGEKEEDSEVKSIHHIVAMKEKGLEKLLHYDWYMREGCMDHFLLQDVTLDKMLDAEYIERGEFILGEYDFDLKQDDKGATLELIRNSTAWVESTPHAVRIKKTYRLEKDSPELTCDWELTAESPLDITFAVEDNVAFPGTDEEYWFYRNKDGSKIGGLQEKHSFDQQEEIGVVDKLKNTDLAFKFSKPADFWMFPIRTVSQSESGFESTFQSSAIVARWQISLASGQPWQVRMTKAIAEPT